MHGQWLPCASSPAQKIVKIYYMRSFIQAFAEHSTTFHDCWRHWGLAQLSPAIIAEVHCSAFEQYGVQVQLEANLSRVERMPECSRYYLHRGTNTAVSRFSEIVTMASNTPKQMSSRLATMKVRTTMECACSLLIPVDTVHATLCRQECDFGTVYAQRPAQQKSSSI